MLILHKEPVIYSCPQICYYSFKETSLTSHELVLESLLNLGLLLPLLVLLLGLPGPLDIDCLLLGLSELGALLATQREGVVGLVPVKTDITI